jgi:GT2 family glycosyltransferase
VNPARPGDRVTAVVVSWNAARLTSACLTSLETQTAPPSRILVVDNASEDDTLAVLAERHPDVDVLVAESNTGFAGGAARALAEVSTPYAVLLNNDATADPALVAAFVAALEAPDAARVGAVTGTVVLTDGRLNSTGNVMTTRGRGSDRGWLQPDVDSRRDDPDVFGFCGAATALRMSAVREVGGIDADLFLYYEDTDLSWRLRAAGWTVRYVPAARATHRHAATSRDGSPLFTYWNERNSLLVFTRHAPAQLVLRVLLRRAAGLLVHTLRRGLQDAVTRARWRGVASYVRRLPRTLIERRAMWRGAPIPRREVARLLVAPDRAAGQ